MWSSASVQVQVEGCGLVLSHLPFLCLSGSISFDQSCRGQWLDQIDRFECRGGVFPEACPRLTAQDIFNTFS